jgi:hypothetical protein
MSWVIVNSDERTDAQVRQTHDCPTCGVAEGQRCRSGSNVPMDYLHVTRRLTRADAPGSPATGT